MDIWGLERCANWSKRGWQGRYRWGSPPPVVYLSLTGEIEYRSVERLVGQIEGAGDAPLHIQIESGGGAVHAGFDLFRAIRSHPGPTTTATDLGCHSAALLGFLAGDSRLASARATFLIHGSSQYSSGHARASAMRATAAELEEIDEQIRAIITCRTNNYSGWQLRQDMDNERLLCCEEASLLSIVTTVV